MSKELKYGSEARTAIKAGLDKLADAVKVTLGPMGQTVIIEKSWGVPHITKDGVSVAKEIQLKDPFENIGAQLVKSVSQKTAEDVGDGTTTATVLAQEMTTRGFKVLQFSGNAPIITSDIKRGMHKALDAVVKELDSLAIKISNQDGVDPEKLKEIATISANGDSEIGGLISEAFDKIGKDGAVMVEESKGMNTYIELVEGMQIDKGFVSPHFVNNKEKMVCELENPFILLYDGRLDNMNSILHILDEVVKINRSILIIADEVEGELLGTLIVNGVRGILKVCAIKAPAFGDRRREIMQDIAAMTSGTYISSQTGYKLEDCNLTHLGTAEKVSISKDDTVILNGDADPERLSDRVEGIKWIIENSDSEYEREKAQERLAKISGGIAVLYVGAYSEVELKEKRDRVDDAVNATRAAIEEGIVPGGGMALFRCKTALDSLKPESESDHYGIQIVKDSLDAPLIQIIRNSGQEPGMIIPRLTKNKLKGYDARKGDLVDMIQSGIIDPKKVTRTAIQNAVSVASTLLTTGCVIIEESKPKSETE